MHSVLMRWQAAMEARGPVMTQAPMYDEAEVIVIVTALLS